MASRSKDERANVNALIKAIQKNSVRAYVHIDRDSGRERHTSSGWDFLLSCDGKTVFCEAKQSKGKLTAWQEFTRELVRTASCKYVIVRFSDDGKYFAIDDGKMVDIEKANINDFIG